MALETFANYPRPHLSVQDGHVQNDGGPVPRSGFNAHLPRYAPLIARLSVVQLFNKAAKKLDGDRPSIASRLSKQALVELTLAIFADLHDRGTKDNRKVFFVHLPVAGDYRKSLQLDQLRNFLQYRARQNSWYYIDLIEPLRALDPATATRLFITRELNDFSHSRGHYSERGNRYFAGLLSESMQRYLAADEETGN